MKARYIPNILSCIRLILVGVFVYCYVNVSVYVSLAVFFIAGATDVLDGILARRYNWITDVGKILDPIADKSMQCTVLICMSVGSAPLIPWWLTVFFIVKELLMGLGTIFVFKKKDTVVSSKWFGKLAVCVFYATIFTIGFFTPEKPVVILLSLITIAFALGAFISYTKNYIKNTPDDRLQSGEAQDNCNL